MGQRPGGKPSWAGPSPRDGGEGEGPGTSQPPPETPEVARPPASWPLGVGGREGSRRCGPPGFRASCLGDSVSTPTRPQAAARSVRWPRSAPHRGNPWPLCAPTVPRTPLPPGRPPALAGFGQQVPPVGLALASRGPCGTVYPCQEPREQPRRRRAEDRGPRRCGRGGGRRGAAGRGRTSVTGLRSRPAAGSA